MSSNEVEISPCSANMADDIAKLCYKHYASMCKTGKPLKGKEWTLMSAIIKRDSNSDKLEIVSLATGSKCIGRNSMAIDGTVVNDSHAEVLARRCFLRYLYHEINEIESGKQSEVLVKTNRTVTSDKCNNVSYEFNKYALRQGISFHMFSSHIPCGDASILPKHDVSSTNINIFDSGKSLSVICNKRKLNSDYTESVKKKTKTDNEAISSVSDNLVSEMDFSAVECIGDVVSHDFDDIHRTGAKCLPNDPRQDLRVAGAGYHVVHAVRTKPGRGDPTLSVSCSDKIARWIAVGIQGALLSLLIEEPICLSSVIIGGGGPYSYESLYRAIISRTKTNQRPQLLVSNCVFEMSKYSENNASADRPSASALMWTNVPHRPIEVGVLGRRQGTTKKSKDKGSLLVSKRELFKTFIKLTDKKFVNQTYESVKKLSKRYQDNWSLVKTCLGAWTEKPKSFNEFFIVSEEL